MPKEFNRNTPTGHPYYAIELDGNGAPRRPAACHLFGITTCQKCGKEVQAPNACGTPETPARLRRLGYVEHPYNAEELGYCEALEMATCGDCHVEEPIPCDGCGEELDDHDARWVENERHPSGLTLCGECRNDWEFGTDRDARERIQAGTHEH